MYNKGVQNSLGANLKERQPKQDWWRASRYEFVGPSEEPAIVPAERSSVEWFNPWTVLSEEDAGGLARSAYARLADIGGSVDVAEAGWQRDESLREQVLEFAQRYGLLGVLLHETAFIRLPPIICTVEDIDKKTSIDGVPMQLEATSWGAGWFTADCLPHEDWCNSRTDIASRNDRRAAHQIRNEVRDLANVKPIPEQSWDRTFSRSTVWVRRFFNQQSEECDVESAWAPFFPTRWDRADARPKDYFPLPWSFAFRCRYGEPLSEFVRIARIFRAALFAAQGMEPTSSPDRRIELFRLLGGDEPTYGLSNISASCQIRIDKGSDGASYESQRAPTLLALLAMAALKDILASRKLRTCAVCGSLFSTSRSTRDYCSSTCKNTSKVRRYRAKRK